jgi:ubiquitin C-terminal hydrolase
MTCFISFVKEENLGVKKGFSCDIYLSIYASHRKISIFKKLGVRTC